MAKQTLKKNQVTKDTIFCSKWNFEPYECYVDPNISKRQAARVKKFRGHAILTLGEANKTPVLGATSGMDMKEVKIQVRYFLRGGFGEWRVIEMDATTGKCYGIVDLGWGPEYGYFVIPEMECMMQNGGLTLVERDMHYSKETAQEAYEKLQKRYLTE